VTDTTQTGDRRRRPEIWGREIPFRNEHFTGREKQLAALRERLMNGSTAVIEQPSQPVPLYGMGGVGKTELAAEYAHRYSHEYRLCWWVRSENQDLIINSLLNLGRMMQLEDLRLDERDYSLNLTLDALNRGEPFSDWLLIFDDVSNAGMVARFLPQGPGHVIITSRDTLWRKAIGVEGIEVAEFEPEETIEFLRSRVPALSEITTDPDSESTIAENERRLADVTELAAQLDNLPVAADHAAAYLVETAISVQEYLDLLRQNAHRLFATNVDIPYPKAVAATWSVSRQIINAEADALFTLLAFFAPEPIYRELILQPGKVTAPTEALQDVLDDPAEYRRASRQLARFSLAKINGVRDVIQIHRVVQAVTQGQLKREDPETAESLRTLVHSLLAASDPNAPDRDDSEEAYERSRQHIVASGGLNSPDTLMRRLVINQVRRLYRRGGFRESLNLGQAALRQWREQFGPDDRQTLTLSVEVGAALRRIGRSEDALHLNEDTLSKLREQGETEGRAYLLCARSYDLDLLVLGRYSEALENDLALLPLYEKVFGSDSIHTLETRNNIAIGLRCLGRFSEALEWDTKTLAARERLLGDRDSLTLTSRFAVARNLRRLGRWDEALEMIRDVHNMLAEIGSPWNQFRLVAAADFGVSLRRAGYREEGAAEGEQVLKLYAAVLGPDNRDALRAAVNIINDRRVTGDLPGAQELGERTVESWEKVAGPEHPNTVAARANLANVLRASGNPKAARELDEKALRDFTQIFGEEHPSTLVVMTNLASDLAAMGEVRLARERGERSLELHRQVRGFDHPCTLATASNLSVDRRADNDPAAADELHAEAIRLYDLALGSEHPDSRLAINYGRIVLDIEPMMD
jgi:tetratricopeptide (TPR) repeat protein